MEKKFWISIRDNHFEIPAGQSAQTLRDELFAYIGSTDPELRDTIGLEAFYNWLNKKLYSPEEIRWFITRLVANLQQGIGKKEDDSIFLRSFSALWLSNIVQNDNETQVLGKEDIVGILHAALAYFLAETDLRGYVPIKGYAHAIAHSADLLGALGHSRYTDTLDHIKILECFAVKMRAVTYWIFIYNEDSRLARAMLGILTRGTLTMDQVKDWLTSLSRNWYGAWRNEGSARAYSNGRALLRALHWSISMWKGEPIPGKDELLKLIQETLEQARPWEWNET
jgi:hypothetical protein